MTFLSRWADAIEKPMKPIARIGIYISMVSLFLMVIFVVADIFSRNLLDIGLYGVKDLLQFLLCFITFLGLPWVTFTFHHVKVDLIMGKFPVWVQHVTDACTGVLGLMVWSMIAWRTTVWAFVLSEARQGAEVLEIPMFPFVFVAAFGVALTCIIIIAQIFRYIDQAIAEGGKKALWILLGLALAGLLAWGSLNVEVPINPLIIMSEKDYFVK